VKRIRNSWWIVRVLCALASLAPIAAHAADHVTAEVQVTATVIPNCRLTIDPLVFGSYDPLGAHNVASLDGAAQLTVACTRETQATIVMDGGRNAGQDAPIRLLSARGENLSYQLFRDSARTQVWGRGSDAFAFVSEGGIAGQRVTVYARIPPGQEVPAGTYTDVVTASVDF
jgi:spore coat protein U-like protein